MKKNKIFITVFMILVLLSGIIQPLIATSEEISDKILRLHIIANSDSSYDQNIKLELKDYFLENTKDIFVGNSLEENLLIAQKEKGNMQTLCNNFLKKYNCSAALDITEEYFDTRVYDDFTLPAGIYNSIKITIGQGNGHNWWCIVFPSVCLSACSTSMKEYLTDDEINLIEDGYTPKFKIVEIYEKLKNKLSS